MDLIVLLLIGFFSGTALIGAAWLHVGRWRGLMPAIATKAPARRSGNEPSPFCRNLIRCRMPQWDTPQGVERHSTTVEGAVDQGSR